jgi:hypothetical protein
VYATGIPICSIENADENKSASRVHSDYLFGGWQPPSKIIRFGTTEVVPIQDRTVTTGC